MALLDRFKRQKAVYWERGGNDIEGRPTYSAPVVIRCRWEDKTQTFLDKKGNEQVSNTQVYTDNTLVLGSALKKVPDSLVQEVPKLTDAQILTQMDLEDDPYDNDETWEVRQTGEQPNIRARKFLRWCLL